MELVVKTEYILDELKFMESLIEGRFSDDDLTKSRYTKDRLVNLIESQITVRGFRTLLHYCEPVSALRADDFCDVLGKVDDFLIWAKLEIHISIKEM